MDGTRLLVCFIVMSFCSLSKQDENFGKQKSAGQEDERVCEPKWIKYKNHCYKLNLDELNWENAERSCNDDGASLVYIEDSAENEWLANLCPVKMYDYRCMLDDKKQEDHWVWSHNMATANYTAWKQGQPDDSYNEDCGVLQNFNQWNDLSCWSFRKYICKKTTLMGFITSVNIRGNKTFSFHEGEDINIECEAEAVSVTGKLDFNWTLNGYLVRPTRSSRIKITYSKTEAVKYISTLHISNFMQSDEGNFTCTTFIGNARKDVNVTVITYHLTLESSNTAVKKGSNITATCTVYPQTEFVNNSLNFGIDSKLVDTVDNAKIKYEKNKAVLTKVSLTRDISITCGFIAKEQCHHKEIRIAVFEPEYFPCPTQTDEKHLSWPETFPGFTAIIKCPPGFTGIISRKCRKDGYNGTWSDPNFTNCTREEIAEIEKKLNRIKDGVGVDKLVNVIREFRNTSENIVQTNLTASDIRAGVQVLATVSEIVTSREENITVEETEEFFYATDVLLSGGCKESWQDLYNETKDNSASRVMDIVGNIFNRAMENLVVDKPISVIGKNIVLLIENTNISSIAFPKNKTSDITSEVELSEETIKNSLKVNSSVRYSAAYYKTLGDFLPNSFNIMGRVWEFHARRTSTSVYLFYGKEELGSSILAFFLPSSDILRQLDPPIRMTFKTKETYLTGRLCSYWDQKIGVWAGDGCWATAVNETFTECKCNHLTNFAVLISLKEISQDHHKAMSLISLVGFIASIVFLIVTVAVYIYYWRYLKSDKALILMIMCIILILAYLTFIIGIENTQNKNTCTALAVTLHYLFLVFVCLMATEGIIHTVMVVCRFQQTQPINRILIPMSFGVPLVIVAVSGAITQLDGYGTDKFCWLNTKNGLIYSFLGPCYAVVIINLVITGLLFKTLYSTKATMNKSRRDKIRTGIRSLLILAPVFGLTWLFGFFYFHDDAVVFAYLFVIFNSLQGLLIFIMHTFMNQTVKKLVTRTISKLRKRRETASTSDTSTTKKKIRDKASSDNKFTTDGAGLKSSTSDSTYELKMNDKNSVKEESRVEIGLTEQREKKFGRSIVSTSWNIFKKNKMTYRVQRNLQTNDEDSVVFNPTYRMISIEETCVTTF